MATARVPIEQAGYISATSEIQQEIQLRTAAGPYILAKTLLGLIGQSASALPLGSDVDLLSNSESIVNLYAEIADSTLDFRMPQEQLHGP